jgi:hypothetical protein
MLPLQFICYSPSSNFNFNTYSKFGCCETEIIWYFRETKLGLWVECLCVCEIFGLCEFASDIWERNEKEEPGKNKLRWARRSGCSWVGCEKWIPLIFTPIWLFGMY